MGAESHWQTAENILCVRLDSLGDVLMTSPAFRALKEGRTGRKITLLTSASGEKIASLIPEIDETIVYDPPWMKASQPPVGSTPDFQMIERLKTSRFDAVVIFTTFSQSPLPGAMMAFLADIPLRLAHCRENPYYLLTDWVPETDHFGSSEIRHEVRRQLDLVAAVGSATTNEFLSLQVPLQAFESTRQKLGHVGLDVEKPWLVLHPGATAASRRYPAESYAAAAGILASDYGFQVLFSGTRPETELVEAIQAGMGVGSFSLVGALDLQEFSALISLAPLLISNNTGPVHIAAAVNTPVVDLYALTNPQHGPWEVPHRMLYYDVPCKFCYKSICPLAHHNCLRLVPPQEVVTATLDLLQEVKYSPFPLKDNNDEGKQSPVMKGV